ncbi:hypothetical protein PHLCEN_2v4393 [Hermanssonia centrifuga]|uniref:Uncharacterized protein n=1 Tax=Hermanssonia centrifuga TaxID=98765 RepID=A0A2R6PNM0_9APHY|nr:hypothetical protein PHLCEN_2v4393 [Hermanssonia centrifuga]
MSDTRDDALEHPTHDNASSSAPITNSDAPRYNIFTNYSVVIDHPLDEVFKVLGDADGMERVVRLSGLCSGFTLQTDKSDMICTPGDAPLSESSVRTIPAGQQFAPGGRLLSRRFFHLQEAIPIIFGLFNRKVNIYGTQTWDPEEKVALYESTAEMGVVIWKLRRFQEIEDGEKKKTKVSETIKGRAPALLQYIVQKQAVVSHR